MYGVYVINAEGYGRLVFDDKDEDRAFLNAYNNIVVQKELYAIVQLEYLPASISHLDMLRLAGQRKAQYLIKELREARNGPLKFKPK